MGQIEEISLSADTIQPRSCIDLSVFIVYSKNLGKTGLKIHTTESTSGHSSVSESTCIPAMRSCITALHNSVSRVEDSMARKEIALAALPQTL